MRVHESLSEGPKHDYIFMLKYGKLQLNHIGCPYNMYMEHWFSLIIFLMPSVDF